MEIHQFHNKRAQYINWLNNVCIWCFILIMNVLSLSPSEKIMYKKVLY